MKRLIALALFLSAFSLSQAQLDKGNFMLGATTSGAGLSIDNQGFGIALSPHGGYFIVDRMAVGARLGIQWSTAFSGGSGSNLGLGLLPFFRYYIQFREKLSFPVQVEMGLSEIRWTLGDSTYQQGISFGGAVMGGIAFFPNTHLSLDFMAGYSLRRFSLSGSQFGRIGSFEGQWGATLYFGK